MSGRVAIVGTGNVGVAAAYALFQQRVARELLLVDRDRARAEGEAMDLAHGQALVGSCPVRAADWPDLAGCDVVVLAAGVGQQPGEDRLSLLQRNAEVLAGIAAELDHHAPEAVVIVASNPVDLLTRILQRLSRRPAERILGTGTMLDTSRFRALLGQHYGINPRSVHAYILGEHGDSEVPLWSDATIGGQNLRGATINGRPWDPEALHGLFTEVRDAAYAIIQRKGYTNTAIGLVIAYLTRVVLDDQKSVVPVSAAVDGEFGLSDLCLSLPRVVGAGGVEGSVLPEPDEDERAALTASGETLAGHLAGLDLDGLRA